VALRRPRKFGSLASLSPGASGLGAALSWIASFLLPLHTTVRHLQPAPPPPVMGASEPQQLWILYHLTKCFPALSC
jgi:hypothetical protein